MGFKFKISEKSSKYLLILMTLSIIIGERISVWGVEEKGLLITSGNEISGKSNHQAPIRYFGREEPGSFLPKPKGKGSARVDNDKKSTSLLKDLTPDPNGFTYVGCFDVWINNQWNYDYSAEFNPNHTRESCTQICKNFDLQVALLRGGQCACLGVKKFRLKMMPISKCEITCPVSTLSAAINYQAEFPTNACGGNQWYSVYCNTNGTEDCAPLSESEPSEPIETLNEHGLEPFHISTVGNFMGCASCNNADACVGSHLSPFFDYFPQNNPTSCKNFCAATLIYAATTGGSILDTLRRPPTKYAALLFEGRENKPMCTCLNDLSIFTFVDLEFCNEPCPGDSNVYCGNREKKSPVYANVYCTNEAYCTTTTSTSPISGNPETTGTTPETTPETTPTTTIPSSTTTYKSSTITSPSPIISTTQLSTTKITTHSSTSATTTNDDEFPEIGCNIKCKGTEWNGRFWDVCAGMQMEIPCGDKNTTGKIKWRCTLDGHFETEQPNYSDCHSTWFNDMEDPEQKINDTASAIDFLTQLTDVIINESYFGHEIEEVTTILAKAVEKAGSITSDSTQFEEIAEKAINVSQHMVVNLDPWHQLTNVTRSTLANNLINTIEDTSLLLTSKVIMSSSSYEKPLSMSSSKYLVSAGAFSKYHGGNSKEAFEFPKSRTSQESFIRLPPGWRDLISMDKIEFVGMFMDSEYAHVMLPGQFKSLGVKNISDKSTQSGQPAKIMNGKLMSFTLAYGDGDIRNYRNITKLLRYNMGVLRKRNIRFKGTGVQITFVHDLEAWGDGAVNIRRKLHPGESPKAAQGSSKCVFWDTEQLIWSTDGCKIVSSSRYETTCECNHLTSFAVLMDVHNYTGKDLGLEISTLILCSMSFLCLFVSVIILSTIHVVKNDRTTITRNLSICLLIGNTLVLLVLDRNYFNMSDGFCVASGILSHYVFLAAFSWMAIEGVHLYKMVIHVFDSESNPLKIYRIISYGVPLIIVAITVVVGYLKDDRPYGGDAICWLDGNYIWSFMVPVILVVMENFIILFIALKTAYQLQNNNTKMPAVQSRVRSLRTLIKGCFSLTILLGLSWLIGFFTLVPAAPGLVAAYLFTIINSSQGIFIFVFHCLLNDKVRMATHHKFGYYLPSWLISSSQSTGSTADQEPSILGKHRVSNMKSSLSDSALSRNDNFSRNPGNTGTGKFLSHMQFPNSMEKIEGEGLSIISPPTIETRWNNHNALRRRDSCGTVSSVESVRVTTSSGSFSDSSSGNNTDNSLRVLVQTKRRSSNC